jgi:hypothetical protein
VTQLSAKTFLAACLKSRPVPLRAAKSGVEREERMKTEVRLPRRALRRTVHYNGPGNSNCTYSGSKSMQERQGNSSVVFIKCLPSYRHVQILSISMPVQSLDFMRFSPSLSRRTSLNIYTVGISNILRKCPLISIPITYTKLIIKQ